MITTTDVWADSTLPLDEGMRVLEDTVRSLRQMYRKAGFVTHAERRYSNNAHLYYTITAVKEAQNERV